MRNPFKRKSDTRSYETERLRLLEWLESLSPTDPDYAVVMTRLDELDKINNRSTEFVKTVVPAVGTVAGVAGVYALQQFGGILVPKALEAIASRSPQKPSNNS